MKKLLASMFAIYLLGICFIPIVQAQSNNPDFDFSFEPSTPQSVRWQPYQFGMINGFPHIYGNFTIILENTQ